MAKHSSIDVKLTTLGTITIAEHPSFTSMDSNLSPQVSSTPMFKRGCKGFQCMKPGQLANQQNRRKVYFDHTNLWSIFPFFVLSFNLFYNFKTHTHTQSAAWTPCAWNRWWGYISLIMMPMLNDASCLQIRITDSVWRVRLQINGHFYCTHAALLAPEWSWPFTLPKEVLLHKVGLHVWWVLT